MGLWGALRLGPSTPTPTPPQEVKNVEEVRSKFGPNLVPKAPEIFCCMQWGVKFRFDPRCVYTQDAKNFMGNPNMYAKQEFF